jgi:hypothetical protein
LFSRAEIAGMRDWAAARNHCPERDAFRREHERHRAWGLQRRHAAKLRHVRQQRSAPPAAPAAPATRGNHPRPAIAARRPPTWQAETAQPPPARATTPQATATKTPTPQPPPAPATTPQATATKTPAPQAPPAPATTPQATATKTPAPQAPPAPATTPQATATKTPTPQPPPAAAVASTRDAGRTSSVMAPRAPSPASGLQVPQPAGPQSQTPRAPLPTRPPPEADRTPRRALAGAAASGRTFMNFFGHRASVVTVTLGAVRHREVRRGHHVVVQPDNTRQWCESRADTCRLGNTDGSRESARNTDCIHDPPGSPVVFRRRANDFGITMHHSQLGMSGHARDRMSLIATRRFSRHVRQGLARRFGATARQGLANVSSASTPLTHGDGCGRRDTPGLRQRWSSDPGGR